MMYHPAMAQQLAAEHQRDLLGHARRHHQARTARAARPAAVARTRPPLLRRVHAVLTSH